MVMTKAKREKISKKVFEKRKETEEKLKTRLKKSRERQEKVRERVKRNAEEVLEKAKAMKNISAKDLISEMVTEEKREPPVSVLRVRKQIIEDLAAQIVRLDDSINKSITCIDEELKKSEHTQLSVETRVLIEKVVLSKNLDFTLIKQYKKCVEELKGGTK